MALQVTPANFRAELARLRLGRDDVCPLIDMNRNTFNMFVNEYRPLQHWAAHNIGVGINKAAGRMIFDVDMSIGLLHPKFGRKPNREQAAPAKPRIRRHKKRDTADYY